MVDILRHTPRKSFSEEFGSALGSGVSKEVSKHFKEKMEKETRAEKYEHEIKKEELRGQVRKDIATQKSETEAELLALRRKQQDRLARDSLAKIYDTKIKELTTQIGNTLSHLRQPLLEELDKVKQERDTVIGVSQLLETYKDQFQKNLDEEDEEEELEEFDEQNPEHRDIAQKLFKSHGDIEEVRKILKRNFKL